MTAPVPPAPLRVDERVLGAGTTMRFVLLMVLIVVTAGLMALQTALLFSSNDSTDCMLAAGIDPENSTPLAYMIGTVAQQGPYLACTNRHAPPMPWWIPVTWPLVVLAVGVGLFVVLPAIKIRRRRAVPLGDIDKTRDLALVLAELTSTVRLARAPRFVVDLTAESAGAVVFGRNRRPTVCLDIGLLAKRRSDPERFRAVLLHEIAHIRNGDVTVTYLTVAMWRVFLPLVALPFLAVTIATTVRWSGASLGATQVSLGARNLLLAGALMVLVTLARADVLRSREIHADVTAVRWGADMRQWTVTAPQPKTMIARVLALITELWRTHPQWQLRHDSLNEPRTLFGIQPLPLFITGAAATLINYHLWAALGHYRIGPFGPLAIWSQQVIALATAGLVVAVVGVAIWRAVAYAVLTGHARPSSVWIGLWLGLGLAAAEVATQRSFSPRWIPTHPEALALVVVGSVVLAWWIGQSAELGIRVWRGRTLRPVMVVGLIAAWLTMAWWFAWWVAGGGAVLVEGWPFTNSGVRHWLSQRLAGATTDHPADVSSMTVVVAMIIILATNIFPVPLAALGVIVLWVVPLLAWSVRRSDTVAPWRRNALLNDNNGSAALPTPQPLPVLRRILLPGLITGLTCWAAAMGVRALIGAEDMTVAARTGDLSLRYLAWIAMTLLAAAVIAATVACGLVSRYRLITALVAAHTAVLVGFAGTVVVLSLDDCARPANSTWIVCHGPPASLWTVFRSQFYDLLPVVLILATIIAVLVAACFRVLDRVRPSPNRGSTLVLPTGRTAWRRLGISALCAMAIVVVGVHVDHVRRAYAAQPDPSVVQQTAQQVLGTTDVPISARTKAMQVDAWLRTGGEWLIQHVRANQKQYDQALRDLARPGHGTWEDGRTRLKPVCAEFGRLAGIAAGYFRVPDRVGYLNWQATIDLMTRGSRNCQQAVDQRNADLLRSAHNELGAALIGCTRAEARIKAVQDDRHLK